MESKELKEIVWIGSSLKNLRKFPDPVKYKTGFALYRAQLGKSIIESNN